MITENKLYIEKSQLTRLKILLQYLKKLESVSPLESTQLFVVDGGKLTVYGYGNGTLGSGACKASFDLGSQSADDFYFSCELADFIKFLDKLGADLAEVVLRDGSTLIFRSASGKSSVFTKTIQATVDAQVEEIKNAITDYEASDRFKQAKKVDLKNSLKSLQVASQLLSLLNTNKFIKIDGGALKAVDDCSIIELSTDITEDVSILRSAVPLLDDELLYSTDDDKQVWIYVNSKLHGITFFFAQEAVNFQCPTDDEVAEMTPKPEKMMHVSIDTEAFFKAFSEFKDVFVTERWQYKQIRITSAASSWKLHFDDMVTSVDTELPFELISSTDTKDEFTFMIPFMHLSLLSDLLKDGGNTKLEVEYSSSPDDVITTFKGNGSGFKRIIICKLQ